ncbi:MAG: PIN domain-containing protein [Synergistaceae bacterium]|nr:PIN domain-containing protein [Synergistaceae bacterium]
MKILIDTNIFLDWLLRREPFLKSAEKVIEKCFLDEEIKGFVTPHSLSDIFYITRKKLSVRERKHFLLSVCRHFDFIMEEKELVKQVLSSDSFDDLEDGLQMLCAASNNLDYIITRDLNDFKNSPVPAIAPDKFLELFSSEEKLN